MGNFIERYMDDRILEAVQRLVPIADGGRDLDDRAGPRLGSAPP